LAKKKNYNKKVNFIATKKVILKKPGTKDSKYDSRVPLPKEESYYFPTERITK
jgi:hypothetical protein